MTHALVDPLHPVGLGREQMIARTVISFATAAEVAGYDARLGTASTATIAVGGRLFDLDPNDLTSAADGYWVVVSADGRRFKAVDAAVVIDVQGATISAPPILSAAVWGQSWLVPAGATGEWAAQSDHVAVASPRGWVFVPPRVGMLIYDRGIDAYRRYATTGWILGLGSPSPGSVAPDALALPFGLVVVSRTVTAPPVVPLGMSVYIVPSGATGDWAARVGQIAIGRRTDVGTTWTYLSPQIGARVWCLAEDIELRFASGGWASDAGPLPPMRRVVSYDTLSLSGNTFTWGGPTPTLFTTAGGGLSLIHAARRAGNVLRLRYQMCTLVADVAVGTVVLFTDSSSVASQWLPLTIRTTVSTYVVEFLVTAVDAAAHTYSIRFGANVGSPTNHQFTLEEAIVLS